MHEASLRIAFTGDLCLASILRQTLHDPVEFANWPDIKQAIGQHDLLVGNLECCLVDQSCSATVRGQVMSTPARQAAVFLRKAGFTDMCIANNHMLDCGPEAIRTTRESLASHDIRMFGAGANRTQAEATVFINHGKYKIAFISACDYSKYHAAKNRAGVAPLKTWRLRRRVRDAAINADLIVVTLHADLEFSRVPGRWRQRLSRRLIDHGAHMVIQHHPHVLQGIETYRDGIIAYSLGNFIFKVRGNSYQENRPGVFDSLVLAVDVDLKKAKPRLAYRLIPLRIGDNHLPYPLTGNLHDEAVSHMRELSSLTKDAAALRHAWFKRCRREITDRAFRIYYALARGEIKRSLHETWRLVALPEDRRWLLGLLSVGYL